jgi:hypothetical protein
MSDLTPFRYADLDAETRIVVQQRTGEIKSLMKRSAQDILDIGAKMVDVQARIPHGSFLGWLALEFPDLGRSTAYNLMAVARQFDGANFQQLEISTKALYLLASPSTPEAARTEALERAQGGEKITYTTAQSIVSPYRPQAAPFTPPGQPLTPISPSPALDDDLDWGGADDPFGGVQPQPQQRSQRGSYQSSAPRYDGLSPYPPLRAGPPTPRITPPAPTPPAPQPIANNDALAITYHGPRGTVAVTLATLHELPRDVLLDLQTALDAALARSLR